MRIRQATDAASILRIVARPPEVIARRLRDGALCFVAERDGEAVGYIWLKLDRYEEDEVRCEYRLHPAGRAAWDFDAFIVPKSRMTRAFMQLWEAAFERLRELGCRWSASRISAFNPGSLNSQRRLGAILLHTGVFLAFGPVQFTLLSCRPFVHLAFNRRSRPTIVLRLPMQ
jgi:GNAT superfamily N-acetyltransferase